MRDTGTGAKSARARLAALADLSVTADAQTKGGTRGQRV